MSRPRQDADDQGPDRDRTHTSPTRSKECYESLLRAVDYNTGGPNSTSPQPPAARESSIVGTLCRGQFDADDVRRAIRAATENGDLLQVTVEGIDRLSLTTDAALRELSIWAAELEEPARDVVAQANREAADE